MTEDEAKTKWCPFVRGGDTNGSLSRNRDPMGGPDWGARCIGSACMAWRESGTKSEPEGYCGLAGEP